MRVGFLSNQLDNRGTGNAMFDYAHYNEVILGNESSIFTYGSGKHSPEMVQKYLDRFGNISYLPGPEYVQQIDGVDALYHIKYGNYDNIRTSPSVRYCVHSVFVNDPHGDRYATISRWLSGSSETSYVPHIISLPSEATEDIRNTYYIPQTSIVFGRYGGLDTFDISWVWDVMEKILSEYNNTWFLFANTEPFLDHKRVVYLNELNSPQDKTNFILASDYMLHARHRGETFGISVGEFASKGRPIITYGNSGETAHIDILPSSYRYNDQFDLYKILGNLSSKRTREVWYGYTEFSPKPVMKKFQEVFLA